MPRQDQEEISFLRTDDYVCLSCLAHGQSDLTERLCLAAGGFGNRMCFFENVSCSDQPADLSVCVFVLEQALSVRALQEMVSTNQTEGGAHSGHRTLLYGHAILLRHLQSNMYLSCLSTCSSTDKLAFDVGLQENSHAESCWWTIHPASKQRSEGEKVRIGDDLILVSVSSERYLHLTTMQSNSEHNVQASFQQTLWSVIPVSSGTARQKAIGMVLGGDVLRLFHGDECLTVPVTESEGSLATGSMHQHNYESTKVNSDNWAVMYEMGAVCTHARSLWRLEHIKLKWSGGFMSWGTACRLRHVTSGRYLALQGNDLVVVHRTEASEQACAFVLVQSKDDKIRKEERDDEGMGSPDLKFGESMAFLQHRYTGRWLSYQTFETKKRGVGRVEEKRAVLLAEGHMDDGMTMTRAQDEESNAAVAIRRCASLFTRFIKGLESLQAEGPRSVTWSRISMAEVLRCLEDLIAFFVQPASSDDHDTRQEKLKALRNRQDLFQEEGMIGLVLTTINAFSGGRFNSKREFAHAVGEDRADFYDQIGNCLYLLLAAMIRGNQANCAQFAHSSRLDWLFNRLEAQQSAEGVLDALHCVLTDSHEALNMIREEHIQTLIRLLDKQGRDPKVLEVLCSLCAGVRSGAVRVNQDLICDNLLTERDLLLQTRLVDATRSMRPNIFVGLSEGGAIYKRWYYEAVIDSIETVTNNAARLRIGWINTDGYTPHPGGGVSWGALALGDDLFSFAFDGQSLWSGGKPKRVCNIQQKLKRGDVIGCFLDLTAPRMGFSVNGSPVKGFFQAFNTTGMFIPCISMSAKVSVRFVFGGTQGKLKFGPPEGHAPIAEALMPRDRLRIEACFNLGQPEKGIFCGPTEPRELAVFIPTPVDTTHVQLTENVEAVRDRLAVNLHELWAMRKIEQGWTFGERRDDHKRRHPCLTSFDRLPTTERHYNVTLAFETLRTIVALGYHVSYEPVPGREGNQPRVVKLNNNYLQPNGYKPAPLELSTVGLSDRLEELVEALAENTHNVWARDRIRQGWTYGATEDLHNKRSPHLVPYSRVDDFIKQSNRVTATETVKTMLAYNYSIESPVADNPDSGRNKKTVSQKPLTRTFRVQNTWAVASGKWYYEVEVLSSGLVRVGWAQSTCAPSVDVGADSKSYAFDSSQARKWHQESAPYGKVCQPGDVLGCMLDLQDRAITFSLNGELMMDPLGQELAFKGIDADGEIQYVPAFTLGSGHQLKVNFGNDVHSLKYFTCCGLQEGFQPFCVNMSRHIPLWYSREDASLFKDVTSLHPSVEVMRTTDSTPCLKIISKTYGNIQRDDMDFLRLSLPVKCKDHFIQRSLAERRNELEVLHRQLVPSPSAKGLSSQLSTEEYMIKTGSGKRMPPASVSQNDLLNGGPVGSTAGSSLLELPDKRGSAKRSKSPFSLFKKVGRSRETSPEAQGSRLPRVGGLRSGNRSGVQRSVEVEAPNAADIKVYTQFESDESAEMAADQLARENSIAEHMEEYCFSVRVLPGQEPNSVYVGWVTSNFKLTGATPSPEIRQVVVCQLDVDYRPKPGCSEKSAYLVNAGELLTRYGTPEDASKRMAQGLLVTCWLDAASGALGFDLNGREVANKFQVEPLTRLYPAVFARPTAREMVAVEFSRTRHSLSVLSAMTRPPKLAQPQLHARLAVQALERAFWARVPDAQLRVHTLKLSETRGWSMLCEEPLQMLAVHVPEQDRCLDVLELEENPALLRFHAHSLELYRAVCRHGNHRVAHVLTTHVDDKQLMHTIQASNLSGPLRMGFFNLLIAMHLESHKDLMELTQKEFILPLTSDEPGGERRPTRAPSLFDLSEEEASARFHAIPSVESFQSVRPTLLLDAAVSRELGRPAGEAEASPAGVTRHMLGTPPPFPLARLKETCVRGLMTAVNLGSHVRDPIGGSNAFLFVPLLRVADSLLVMGLFSEKDMRHLLAILDPRTFGEQAAAIAVSESLLGMPLAEDVKLELCHLLHHLTDLQLRHQIETMVEFSSSFCGEVQNDQLRRYLEIKQSNLPSSVTARKTREFRCPPTEQMRSMMTFHRELLVDPEAADNSPCREDLRRIMVQCHEQLMANCGVEREEEEEKVDMSAMQALSGSRELIPLHAGLAVWAPTGGPPGDPETGPGLLGRRNLFRRLLDCVWKKKEVKEDEPVEEKRRVLATLVVDTIVNWARESFIENLDLVRDMFSLLHRQYDRLGEITAALDKTYVISDTSRYDLNKMIRALGTVRSLLGVQVGPTEEEALKACLWEIMDNKVFFQHPNLMRCLAVHETVMQLMVHTLTKTSLDPGGAVEGADAGKGVDEGAADMVVMCCRFLCYFCRTSCENQKAMFEHLSYMLENSSMLLARPSLRGSCPLDVAYSSLMDNNELALMLRESQLEKVAIYLSRCGVQSNAELLLKGYPDIGWDPVEGERFLDFLRFTVWVNGESVEENANLVVRLLIRRPECLGPALRGGADESAKGRESGGLLKAMKEGIVMSAQIALANDEDDTLARLLADYEDAHVFSESSYEFGGLPPEDDEDYIDLGGAMLTFYSVLVDLLGRCAPEAETTKPDSVRVQAILRSLVSLVDLEGVISLRFILLPARMETVVNEEGESEVKDMTGLPPGLLPEHKAAVVLFLERVYGITEASTFLRLLENGFLPDMRTATVLDMGNAGESDMALALNRYLCNSVLPLLTKHAHFLGEEEELAGDLMDATLHTTYRLSKCNSLTKGQRDIVSEFLVALTKQLQPHMMTRLLRKLAYDVPSLSPQSVVPLRLLTVYYERCGRYYGTGGWAGHGCATEEERHLTSILFTRIFDSLALRPYDPELFSMALPCLCAIGSALSPDYSSADSGRASKMARANEKLDASRESVFVPLPADTGRISLSPDLSRVVDHFAQHFHDSWALELIEQGWSFGNTLDGARMTHPNLRPYHMLQTRDQHKLSEPIQECLKAMVSWGWRIEREDPMAAGDARSADRRRPTVIMDSPHGYTPTPRDLRNISLTRDVLTMSERLAENAHNCWAKRKQMDLEDLGGAAHHQLVPYDILTEREKCKYRKLALELLKYLQTEGFRVSASHLAHADELDGGEHDSSSPSNAALGAGGGSIRSTDRRFAYRLLVKLLEYVERVVMCVKQGRPSDRYSRSKSFAQAPEDMKFFGKVVLPLVEKYFDAHKLYFVGSHSLASSKEKEYATSLFCKLFSLLRQKMMAFGHDVNISVRCLQGLVHALDFRTLVKNQSVVRVFLLPFFTYVAEDLTQVVHNLKLERFSHLKGTINRGATSLNYVYMVLLPVLKGIFEHMGSTQAGDELLVGDIQVACYRILNGLYVLGTCNSKQLGREQLAAEFERHRPLLGECVAAFASTFPVAFLEPHFDKFNKNSIAFGVEGDLGQRSLEAREVMSELAQNLPTLEKIVDEIADLAESGGKYTEAPHVIEVTLPMLCSYLPFWWARCADNEETPVTSVTTAQMNAVLGNVLKLIRNNIEAEHAPWMTRIATRTQPIVANAPDEMLAQHFLPVATKLQEHALAVEHEEEQYQAEKRAGVCADLGEAEERLQEKVEMLVRNMFAFFPLLIRYVDRHRTNWIKQPTVETGQLFTAVASMFLIWSKSSLLKRAEQNFVSQNEIDHLALIMPGQSTSGGAGKSESSSRSMEQKKKGQGQGPGPHRKKLENFTSLNVACIKRLLPIGLSLFGGREQELVQRAKQKLINECVVRDDHLWLELSVQKENETELEEYLRTVMEEEEDPDFCDKNANVSNKWQKVLYRKIGQAKLASVVDQLTRQNLVDKVISLAKVLHALYLVDHPPAASRSAWRKLISSQRKRAVMACFRMLPIHALPRHKVVNLFLESYKEEWLSKEESPDVKLIEALTSEDDMDEMEVGAAAGGGEAEAGSGSGAERQAGVEAKPDPLRQLITALSRSAESQAADDPLYISYANIMGKSCSGDDEEDDDEGDEDAGVSFQEQEMAKQQLLAEQARLANRGAAEMILLEISACKGEVTDVVKCTIELGIAVLLGGNVDVQAKMLNYLKEKKDVGFFTSMAGLMQQSSVLDLDAFERSNKAEGLGVSDADQSTGNTNLSDAEFTCKLFRFLQLLAEGHNLAFQDYLRSQAGNTTTVNIIICTVDYLLRLQESIMDFYWHYSGQDKIDEAGKKNFCRAIKVGKQVFATLTEDIQGPCVGNQLALAHSRLWDAISGFLYIFANMQEKLSKDPDQLELLREFMNLQKEMMIMLLSMLEGNVVNGPIGKQMVDTLVESSANVEMILKFFDIFLRMKDITSSEAFLAFDVNGDGWISHKEFRSAMESQKMYSEEEIEYIMMCVDANHDGKVDFNEFTERFHNPAKDIGFNLAVLLTNLYEHMPNDPRLERLIGKAKRVLDTFEPYLGRIEIMGSNARIERVYFEIRQSHIDQWEKPQIKESKRSFLHSIVNEGGDKEKLESFTNFCEDSIFEMQHAQAISGEGEGLKLSQVAAVRRFLDSNKVQLAWRAWAGVKTGMAYLTPSNLRLGWGRLRAMTPAELVLTLGRGQLRVVMMVLTLLWHLTRSVGSVIGALMRGDPDADKAWEPQVTLQEQQPWLLSEEQQLAIEQLDTSDIALLDEHYHAAALHGADTGPSCTVGANSAAVVAAHCKHQPNGPLPASTEAVQETPTETTATLPRSVSVLGAGNNQTTARANGDTNGSEATPTPVSDEEEEVPFEVKTIDTGTYVLSLFARNFYQFKICALVLAFVINFTLLFYRVTQAAEGLNDSADAANATANATAGAEDEELDEWVSLPDSVAYCQTLLRMIALLHSAVSFSMLVAYCCLKVPLVIFKREKEVCRMLEFDGMWISEQPSEEDIRAQWDKLVLSTPSFPQMYWDKFVKKKVRNKYSEQYDDEEIVSLLGIQDTAGPDSKEPGRSFIPQWLSDMDLRYQFWKWGVIFTDNSFLYLIMYFLTSVVGNYNYFFFACHLIDVAIGFKTLRTILQSVTHNGKQLVLTVILTSIVIYLYTVIAFNFFRKFYVKDNDGVKDAKCHDMLTCFVFHLHTGLRAGGGIGDEIESPDGDPYEVYRILFDITFFFFVIVILLAIIQGLIIDAFGELRDQLEQVKEDLESKCFICGIGKEYFDKVPHGFEKHVEKEHNFANYMFFIMHLINKPDTEYTGQETYVWELYQQRSWDFFPVGDCFRKQYEDQL